MLRVRRASVAEPTILRSRLFDSLRLTAQNHFAEIGPAARQRRFQFEPLTRLDEIREPLVRLFAGKCAFCETRVVENGFLGVHRFRPPQEAVGVDGEVSWPHYWWLAYEWENLYPECQRCSHSAGSHFPVRGRRARTGRTGVALRQGEQALLLDPCWDDPDDHLAFRDDGVVQGLTEAGVHTIEAFTLNRIPLVEARGEAIASVRALLRADADALTQRLQDRHAAHLGAMRQVAARSALRTRRPALWRPPAPSSPPQPQVQPFELDRVAISDFRAIEQLELTLADSPDVAPEDDEHLWPQDARRSRWTMLLGENGHGKTSVLQAIAVALMGGAARRRLRAQCGSWVRQGADVAVIEVQMRGAPEPRVVHLSADGRFEVRGHDTPAALAAYGASRIPRRHDGRRLPRRYKVRPRVENLFDPHAELMPARLWLHSLDEQTFDFAARALLTLMLQPTSAVMVRGRDDGNVLLDGPDGATPLEDLSDGYRAMVVLAVDLMSVFEKRFGSMDAAEGVVLIDEIGAHLHPRWQMRIVEAFRTAFPRLQVIATTHDPLCLRGMRDREVVVLRRTRGKRIYALPPEEVPPVRGLHVDELLTSEVFGLNSTVDERLDEAFDRYYELLAVADRSPEADGEIERLRGTLDRYRQLGSTRRERLALEAADEFVARERDVVEAAERRELSARTRELLRAIWAGDA